MTSGARVSANNYPRGRVDANEYFPILARASSRRLNRSDMAQEAFMTWNQVETNWWQLKNKFVFGGFRLSGGNSQRSDRSGLELSMVGQSAELQPAAFRPDDRGRRSEFSLHIGC
jgi:hypothetical protein